MSSIYHTFLVITPYAIHDLVLHMLLGVYYGCLTVFYYFNAIPAYFITYYKLPDDYYNYYSSTIMGAISWLIVHFTTRMVTP